MRALSRSFLLPGAALLLVAAPLAFAESPLTDPVAPAVIGRPLDQIRPVHRARSKPVHQPAATAARRPAKPTATAAAPAPGTQRIAKQALDDRADLRMRPVEVGSGTHFARKPLGEGAYFGDRYRSAAQKYYEQHPVMRPAVDWKIGEPVPRDAVVALVPSALLAVLPRVPPGHRYVELGGDVVLVAAQSKMVVDGISRRR